MKIVSAREVRKILRKQWPQLKHIWIFDRKLILLPQEKIDFILKGISVYKQQFKDELFDCDDYALVANAFIKLEVAKLKLDHNCVFGEAAMVHPEIGIHNQNVYITEDFKIKLFEPQANKTILPNGETVFYVRI